MKIHLKIGNKRQALCNFWSKTRDNTPKRRPWKYTKLITETTCKRCRAEIKRIRNLASELG